MPLYLTLLRKIQQSSNISELNFFYFEIVLTGIYINIIIHTT